MQIVLDGNGYVASYAMIGGIVDGIEVTVPQDVDHFEQHFTAYRVRDGNLEYDGNQYAQQVQEQAKADYRKRRETECFAVINRGQLWYENITLPQLLELRAWYKAWLDGTETLIVPDKPAWLE